jgi:hypothetical protein
VVVPACGGAPPAPGIEVTLVGSDGVVVATDVNAAVTIASVDSCAAVSCAWTYPVSSNQSPGSGSSSTATRFVLAGASNQQWTLYLRLPGLPAGLVAPGGAFDLVVRAGIDGGPYESVYQTTVLAHGSRLVAFASNLMALSGNPPLPQLAPYGIAIGDGGIVCQPDQFTCAERPHAVRATVGTETTAAVPGQTIQVGGLSFTNARAVDQMLNISGCHQKPASLLGGFVAGGGPGPSLPACVSGDGASDVVAFGIVGSDGKPIEADASGAVTVASVDSCSAGTCPSIDLGVSLDQATRIGLTAGDGRSWTAYLRDTAMPSDYIKVGDPFDLTIAAAAETTFYRTFDQTMVLARDGKVIVFAASLQRFFGLSVPNLRAFDMAVLDEGAYCQSFVSFGCLPRPHAARVSMATDASIVLYPGQTKAIGGLSITNGNFTENVDTGSCDAKSRTAIAGFKVP